MSLDTLTLPCGVSYHSEPQHSSGLLGLNWHVENRDIASTIKAWTLQGELVWSVVPVTGEDRDLESKKKGR